MLENGSAWVMQLWLRLQCPHCSWTLAVSSCDAALSEASLVEDLSDHLVRRHGTRGADADLRAAEVLATAKSA
jgi:hypothetical protein